jgi:hypothetical protein
MAKERTGYGCSASRYCHRTPTQQAIIESSRDPTLIRPVCDRHATPYHFSGLGGKVRFEPITLETRRLHRDPTAPKA